MYQIPGLQYVSDYITQELHDQLLAMIEQQPWLTDLRRRVQHYGYRYDYKSRSVDVSMFLGPLPTWAIPLAEQMHSDGFTDQVPDQLIINEYEPGQGIASHIDCRPCFGNTILSITLGSTCIMEMTSVQTNEKIPLLLHPRSLLVMSGEARHQWKHGIPARKTDSYEGQVFERGRRVSMTFRNVIIEDAKFSLNKSFKAEE